MLRKKGTYPHFGADPGPKRSIEHRRLYRKHCVTNLPEGFVRGHHLDDHSTDGTGAIVSDLHPPGMNLTLTRLADFAPSAAAYKKLAIESGVSLASGELIVTTDADCRFHPDWLNTVAVFYQEKQAKFIAAPVRMATTQNSLLATFQILDFIGLQGITAASVAKKFHSMCNGANLAYQRAAFIEVAGFRDIDDIPSGDDMLLMHKIYRKYPDGVCFLKEGWAEGRLRTAEDPGKARAVEPAGADAPSAGRRPPAEVTYHWRLPLVNLRFCSSPRHGSWAMRPAAPPPPPASPAPVAAPVAACRPCAACGGGCSSCDSGCGCESEGFFAKLRRRFARHDDCGCGCETAPACGCESEGLFSRFKGHWGWSSSDCGCGCAAAPACGCAAVPSCGCDSGPSFWERLKSRFHRNDCGCDSGCNTGCGCNGTSAYGAPSATPSQPPPQASRSGRRRTVRRPSRCRRTPTSPRRRKPRPLRGGPGRDRHDRKG